MSGLMCPRCKQQRIRDTNRYNVLHYKSTTTNGLLPNISIGSELDAAAWEVKLGFGLQYKLKIIIIINPSVTEVENRKTSDQISIKFDH